MWQRFGALVGGGAAAWLTAQVLSAGLVLIPDAGPASLADIAQTVAAIGSLAGLLLVVLAPVAGALALAVRRVPGGGAVVCGLVGAAGGVGLLALWGVPPLLPAVIAGVLGAVCGVAGWAASSWVGGSGSRVVSLVAVAAGTWAAAVLTV
jgi:hypothetical protein